jgi:Zn-dependent protease
MLIQMLLSDPLSYLRLIVIMILSICLHELAHGVVAISQGDRTPSQTGHITLNPLVHMGVESIVVLCLFGIAWGEMPIDPKQFKSRQWSDVLVSAAGPLSNLGLGFIGITMMRIAGDSEFLSRDFFYLAAIVNFNLFLFNCLPIPPLDGFYIFSKFFPSLKNLQGNNFGSFALVLIMFSGLGSGLSIVSELIVSSALNF